MEQNVFKIKKAFLVPFFLIVALLGVLLLLSLYKGQAWEKAVLSISFIGALIVGIEAAKREIAVTTEGLKIKKFFRIKNVNLKDVTHLAVVELNKKVYFLLTTTKGFYFFSNLYENHSLLIRSIVNMLDIEKVEIEVKNYLDHPVERRSLIVICWLTVLIIIVFIILKLLSA
jgi:lysylphosphatidylglycerol synthetase-like protein (DUF2156 family)